MGKKRCVACGVRFHARPQVPNQSYCSSLECQRARRREWQRQKLQSDPDYRDNKARAQQAWGRRNPDYWRQYRATHPEYVDRNRLKQLERNAKAAPLGVAKVDALLAENPAFQGLYHIKLVDPTAVAKKDVWIVEITRFPCSGPCTCGRCKDMT